MLCILRELLRNSGEPRCVSRNMRENPSETSFHGFLGDLGNSDRNAHWIMRAGNKGKLFSLQTCFILARLIFQFRLLYNATV